mmetsp:Transcript_97865/g.204059  ORF Transcript_97865/g.204059 Transcript_97865/m.204059 type:complete len:298 (+) Transcript_97865:521-1414(+)
MVSSLRPVHQELLKMHSKECEDTPRHTDQHTVCLEDEIHDGRADDASIEGQKDPSGAQQALERNAQEEQPEHISQQVPSIPEGVLIGPPTPYLCSQIFAIWARPQQLCLPWPEIVETCDLKFRSIFSIQFLLLIRRAEHCPKQPEEDAQNTLSDHEDGEMLVYQALRLPSLDDNMDVLFQAFDFSLLVGDNDLLFYNLHFCFLGFDFRNWFLPAAARTAEELPLDCTKTSLSVKKMIDRPSHVEILQQELPLPCWIFLKGLHIGWIEVTASFRLEAAGPEPEEAKHDEPIRNDERLL